VAAFLKELRPDIILVEGPPEADGLLQWIINPQMRPPVALLAYNPDQTSQAVFYPYAVFSPEWQALHYGVYNNIPARFFDLPLAYTFAVEAGEKQEQNTKPGSPPAAVNGDVIKSVSFKNPAHEAEAADAQLNAYIYPFDYLAAIAGYEDGEEWWEMNIESRNNNTGAFEAVQEAVTELRQGIAPRAGKLEHLREAWMRKMIRTAEKEGYERIAVICGAWHVPALANMPKQKEDNDLLKGLEKRKVEVTWVPWTYDRLTQRSGYGAGICSPGWYNHIWNFPDDDGTRWMSHVAGLLRKQNMDTSVAHVIEAVRLANALAALRGHPRPGLPELNEATTTVIGFGDSILLQLIRAELIVSNTMGAVPDEVPKVPLLTDIEKHQKKFRMQPGAGIKELKLDLREENDLAKSALLHRLKVVGINWGTEVQSRSKGTFKEQWQLLWQPEFSIRIIELGVWGNTLEEAGTKYLSHLAAKAQSAPKLVNLLEQSIPANLPDTIYAMISRLDTLAAGTADITELMRTIPGLSAVTRYGNVRNTDLNILKNMLYSIVARVCIGIPLACVNIDMDAAQALLDLLIQSDYAISLSKDAYTGGLWQHALYKIQASHNCHPLISGYCTRLLHDRKALDFATVQKQLSYYMAVNNNPADAAYWFEGFLKSSGTILLLDEGLWTLINSWVNSIDEENFTGLLPVLRRTFAEFTPPERRKLGEKARGGTQAEIKHISEESDFDYQRAQRILPLMRQLLGIKPNT
jgi:hypothetical protein